jgi:MoaA/NifB/PqqE/SkfB family radical SAM enzyme
MKLSHSRRKILQSRSDLYLSLSNKKVLIWGARMTGLGALRQLRSRGIEVFGFVDSDPAFNGHQVANLPLFAPSSINDLASKNPTLVMLIAVSLKEEEIRKELNKYSANHLPLYSFHDEKSPHYTIDILSSCNLKCASCPHSIEGHDTPKGSMTLETFEKVFDKILVDSPDVSHLSLYSWGEPLLHPHIDKIVAYAHERNIAVALSSNLSIKFDNRLDQLISRSPEYLKISVSGYYPTAYNNTHEGGDVNLVKSNLYRLRYAIDKYKSSTLVDINYHLYRDNSGENLMKFEELAKELGFIISKTYALIMPLERVFNYLEGQPDYQTTRLEDNLLVNINEGIEASIKTRLPENNCPFRENQVNINADLSVPVCCTVFDRNETTVAINFMESTIEGINEAKSRVKICERCMAAGLPEYNMGFNKQGWHEIAKRKAIIDIGPMQRESLSTIVIRK